MQKFFIVNKIFLFLIILIFFLNRLSAIDLDDNTYINSKNVTYDEENKILHLNENPSISFDILSINSGSISNKQSIHIKDDSKVISVKPISSLVSKLEKIDEIIEKSFQKKISIVGGCIAAF